MRRFLRSVGWTFIGTGALVLYFLVYQLVGTNAVTNREQTSLRHELTRDWARPAASRGAGGPVDLRAPKPPPVGQALALIVIRKIGVERVVVEGVDRAQLRQGPGHVPKTVMPGQPGNFAVSGHRTTHGAPFYRLDGLVKGDTIQIITKAAVYTYTVTGSRIVLPSDTSVLDDVRGPDGKLRATITLTTCNPLYSARQRLIVFGDLSGTSANNGSVAA